MSLKFIRTPLSLVLAGCLVTAFSARADTVIGVAGPFTGPNATYGDQYWHGATQAAEDINAAGGINGEKIKLVQGDDACEPKQAVAVANRLVDQDKVNAVVGHFCSSSTMPASEVYSDAGIIAITPGSTNPLITERGMSDMFRMCGRDDQQGIVAGDYIVDVLKGKKVAVLHDKDTYGQGLADATRAQLNKRGVKEVLYEGLTRGEKDFNALVTKIRASGAEVVYFGGLHPEAGPLVRQLREQGLALSWVGTGRFIFSLNYSDADMAEVTRRFLEAGKHVLVEKVTRRFGEDLKGKHFALWGLAFKPNTDEAPENSTLLVAVPPPTAKVSACSRSWAGSSNP